VKLSREAVRLVGVVAGAADAGWVATTRPFTVEAELAVIAGACLVAGLAASRWPILRQSQLEAHSKAGAREARLRGPEPTVAAWTVLVLLLVAYELATFAAGAIASRRAFPTLSSLYDMVARYRQLKAVFAAAWLALGWALFRR
jgi:hypothetical protein